MDPALLWFGAGLILVVLEFMAPGVVLVFLGLGAWVTAFAVKAGWAPGAAAQSAWFAGSSLVLLLGLRRFFRAWFAGFSSRRDTSTDLDEFTGRQVTVVDRVEAASPGRVEFKGALWSARCAEGQAAGFEPGERAVITGVEGLCLVIGKPHSTFSNPSQS